MTVTLSDVRTMVGDKGPSSAQKGTRIGRFNGRKTQQTKDKNFYNLKYTINKLEGFEKIKLPTARQMIDTAVSHLPLSKPVIEVIPFNPTAPFKAKAIKQQEYYTALLTWNMRQVSNMVHVAGKDLFLRGEAYIKTLWDESVLGATEDMSDDDKQSLMIEKMPLRMTCPDPMSCYPSPDHIDCHPTDMLEVYDVLGAQIHRIWPNWKPGAADNAKFKFAEYWSAEQVCFLADNDPVTDGVEDNIYKVVPYTHVYSGYGHRDTDANPESEAVSLITHVTQIIEEQCRLHAFMDKGASFAAIPMLILPGTESDYDNPPKMPYPGQVVYLGDTVGGERAKVEWAASNLPNILTAIQLNDGLLSKVQPGVVRGEAPQNIEAGYPMALMIGEARLQFGLPLQNLQTLVARALDQVRVLIRDVAKETVPIWGETGAITLSPDECQGAYRVNVEFDSSTPEARANRALMGQRLRQGGSISTETELKVYHNEKDPKKEINRMRAESIMTHPVLARKAAVDAVRAIEGEQAAEAIRLAMEEGEAGAERKAESSGIPQGGRTEAELPEDVLGQAMSKRGRAVRGETEDQI